MGEVDDLGAGNAGEKILVATGEADNFMGENGAADNELVVIQNQLVEADGHLLGQQSAGHLANFLSRDDTQR